MSAYSFEFGGKIAPSKPGTKHEIRTEDRLSDHQFGYLVNKMRIANGFPAFCSGATKNGVRDFGVGWRREAAPNTSPRPIS